MDRTPNFFFSLPGSRRGRKRSVSISWSYVATIVVLTLLTVGACGGLFWYLSFGFGAPPPQSVAVQGIRSPATISWRQSGLSKITTDNLDATAAAMGYAHAIQNPWQMMLWRQTAMGELSAWFGASLLSLDRFNKQLRFAAQAESTYEALPAEHQARLRAYANGVNRAIGKRRLMAHDDFAFLGADAAPWAPWHGLVVERLFAWLATDWDIDTSALDTAQAETWAQLIAADQALHEFLQVYDLAYSFTGSWDDGPKESGNSFFYQRLVYGATSTPIFQEINLAYNNQPDRLLVTLPGSLLLLASHSTPAKWAFLPRSTLAITPQTPGLPASTSHERITNRDGTEFLATFTHYPGLLSLAPTKPNDSTTYALNWPGFSIQTDVFESWQVLQNKPPAAYQLFTGDGLWQANNNMRILGSPQRVDSLASGGILMGNTQWMGYIAAHMDSLYTSLPAQLNPKIWPAACHNPWAAAYAPGFFAQIKDAPELQAPIYQDAITYLRNWDYSYASSSIGAAIFEGWLDQLGFSQAPARLNLADSLNTTQLRTTFQQTVDALDTAFGPDLSQWRLEQAQPVRRFYAAWVADSLYSADKTPLSVTNYAPLIFPGKGDVTTLCTGSFLSAENRPVSTAWESWETSRVEKHAWYWRKNVTPKSFLERYLISNRPSMEFRLHANEKTDNETQILPAS
ncbi:MAG: penicillin acylase family protein [Bacteroidota bacterium]